MFKNELEKTINLLEENKKQLEGINNIYHKKLDELKEYKKFVEDYKIKCFNEYLPAELMNYVRDLLKEDCNYITFTIGSCYKIKIDFRYYWLGRLTIEIVYLDKEYYCEFRKHYDDNYFVIEDWWSNSKMGREKMEFAYNQLQQQQFVCDTLYKFIKEIYDNIARIISNKVNKEMEKVVQFNEKYTLPDTNCKLKKYTIKIEIIEE